MEREAIERLAIDYAAGELNQDAEALFRNYLAEHPQANGWTEDVRQIYDKTEAAIKTKIAHAEVENVIPGITPVLRVRWWPVARWAAAVVFAAIIGFNVGRREKSDTMYGPASLESALIPKQVKTVSDLKEKYAGTFWGDKMLALVEHKPSQQYKAGFQDISFWDRYRQFIKEKQNE